MTPNQILIELLQAEASRLLEAYPEEIKSGRITKEYANEVYMAIETAIQINGGPEPHPSHFQTNAVVARVMRGFKYQRQLVNTDHETIEMLDTFIKSLESCPSEKATTRPTGPS